MNINKSTIGLFLILIVTGKTFSQEIQFTGKVSVTYDMYIMYMTFPYNLATLDFNNSEAFFSHQEMGDNPNSKSKTKIVKGGDRGNFAAKINTSIHRIYENKESGVLLEYDDNDKETGELIMDSIQPIKWKYIENKTKKIVDYNCFMAEGYFRGGVYTVWYTPEIPSSFGPWKLNGCPGLILEVMRDDKTLSFYATQISFEEKDVTFNIPNKKRITYAQHSKDMSDQVNKFFEEISSQRKRSNNESVLPGIINCLECDVVDDIKRYPNISIKRRTSWGEGDEGEKDEDFPIKPTE
jgi:GLPGLI family protein